MNDRAYRGVHSGWSVNLRVDVPKDERKLAGPKVGLINRNHGTGRRRIAGHSTYAHDRKPTDDLGAGERSKIVRPKRGQITSPQARKGSYQEAQSSSVQNAFLKAGTTATYSNSIAVN